MAKRSTAATPRRDAKTGTWWFIVDTAPGPDGSRRQARRRGFRTKAEAQEALDKLRVDIRGGTYVAPLRQTLGEFLEEWLHATKTTIEPSTHESYSRYLRLHVIGRIGGIQLQSLQSPHLMRLYADLLESGRRAPKANRRYPADVPARVSVLRAQGQTYAAIAQAIRLEFPDTAGTITKDAAAAMHRRATRPASTTTAASSGLSARAVRYIHTIVKRALADAVRWDLIPRNPADAAAPPSASSARSPEMKTWDAATLARFLDAERDTRYGPAWLFLATTGVRRGEALGLRWSDLDLTAGRVRIVQTTTAIAHRIHIQPRTKTTRPRGFELDRRTIAALRGWRTRQDAERKNLGEGYTDLDLVFCLPDGRPYHPERFSREFARRLARHEAPRIRLHDLRHTWATLALEAGVPLKVVSERLGHATTAITADIYSHVLPAFDRQAAETVAASIFGQ